MSISDFVKDEEIRAESKHSTRKIKFWGHKHTMWRKYHAYVGVTAPRTWFWITESVGYDPSFLFQARSPDGIATPGGVYYDHFE